MMVGDNIYYRAEGEEEWQQLDSHHSLDDGSPNPLNVRKDTRADRVLISRHFFYFGSQAPVAPPEILRRLGYENGVGHRVFNIELCKDLIAWIESYREAANRILADPFDFKMSEKRYKGVGSAIA